MIGISLRTVNRRMNSSVWSWVVISCRFRIQLKLCSSLWTIRNLYLSCRYKPGASCLGEAPLIQFASPRMEFFCHHRLRFPSMSKIVVVPLNLVPSVISSTEWCINVCNVLNPIIHNFSELHSYASSISMPVLLNSSRRGALDQSRRETSRLSVFWVVPFP